MCPAQEIREAMTKSGVEYVLQRAREAPQRSLITSDNGPYLLPNASKDFIRLTGMTHVRTSPYYSQSYGKIERWHKTLKGTRYVRASTIFSNRHAPLWRASSSTTTPSVFTVPSATSGRRTSWRTFSRNLGGTRSQTRSRA